MLNFLFVEPITRASTLVPCQHYFSVSKTADFLKYPQTKGYAKKEKCIPFGSFKHHRIRDPPLETGCEAAKWKEKGEEHIWLIGTRSPPKQTCPLRAKWRRRRPSKGKKRPCRQLPNSLFYTFTRRLKYILWKAWVGLSTLSQYCQFYCTFSE